MLKYDRSIKMKKLLFVILSVLFSTTVFAHSGHLPFEMMGIVEGVKHQFSSSYHVVVMLTLSVAFIVSAIVVFKKQQILRSILMVLGFIGTILGVSLLLA